ncbi:MAG TPA: APC family permease [Candidatus Baltobacteraceae bacterium]|jgi:APA family basic amino acid/polyamine antiporter|nr:APC family permease [Candidatus Baltobacteraceae bacterium]
MSNASPPPKTEMKPTLGLTGLTINAMALIAPGAFLWLTYEEQALYGAPTAGSAMWLGIVFALVLCFATALSYAELSKLYPGAGSSYLYAEQAFLSKTKAFKWARLIKFFTGWNSHLYYWIYTGLMVGVTAILAGWLAGQLMPDTFSQTYNSPLFMWLFCVVFAIGVGYIAYRGVNGTTAVNMGINIIQISALVVFAVMAISYRTSHPDGSVGWHLSNGTPVNYNVAQVVVTDDKGKNVQDTWADSTPKVDDKKQPIWKMQDRQVVADDLDKVKNTNAVELASLTALGLGVGDPYPAWKADDKGNTVMKDGKEVPDPFILSYKPADALSGAGTAQDPKTFNFHENAASVVAPHGFGSVLVQACVAILLLVGFESVTAMGEEAKNPKKDIGRAVLLSLAIQGAVCYLFEYFAANYFLNSGYTLSNAGASGAPLGDMMVLVGTAIFGSYSAGKAFMLIEAFTVFLALIGTTLSCMNTGARVTYAMGRDEEVPTQFGMLHGKNLSPHRAVWFLVFISIIFGILTTLVYLGGQSADLAALDKHNFWYSFGIFSPHSYVTLPNSMLIITLISNFGTFLLYMTTCIVAIVAFREHHMFNGFKHFLVPLFGLLANFGCMLFYLVGPFSVAGMSVKEPYIALGFSLVWIIIGAIYLASTSKSRGKEIILTTKPSAA